jgi:hypothetical protein
VKILLNHEIHEIHETSRGDRPSPYRLRMRNALVADTRASATSFIYFGHSWGGGIDHAMIIIYGYLPGNL